VGRAHDILGVACNASPQDIRKAFRILARSHHPDLLGNSPDANERFLHIKAAYELLLNGPTEPSKPTDEAERRAAQLKRRRRRLHRLYER
jgi:hypothetical protein